MKFPLTPAQRRVLEAHIAYTDEHGFSPSVRELASMVGYSSTQSIHGCLHYLESKGCIVFRGPPKISRRSHVTEFGERLVRGQFVMAQGGFQLLLPSKCRACGKQTFAPTRCDCGGQGFIFQPCEA